MKIKKIIIILITLIISIVNAGIVTYAGARSSRYGVDPFPTPEEWGNIFWNMCDQYENSKPYGLWIVGTIDANRIKCSLEFESDGNSYPNIVFWGNDKHEEYLSHFDTIGVKVYLQVESGNADIETLMDLVLNQYGHHKCVVGFGVDVEWYLYKSNPGTGKKATDQEAETWEKHLKSINENYTLFVKHWDKRWMPPTYRGDLIFVNDGQGVDMLDSLLICFTPWADTFTNNTVMYQIGYASDKKWWALLPNPLKEIGDSIASRTKNPDQKVGIIWVDFTLRDDKVKEKLFKDHPVAINEFHGNDNSSRSKEIIQVAKMKGSSQFKITLLENISLNEAHLSIVSASGRIIKQVPINKNIYSFQYDFTNNTAGIYFLVLKTRNRLFSRKLLLIK